MAEALYIHPILTWHEKVKWPKHEVFFIRLYSKARSIQSSSRHAQFNGMQHSTTSGL